MNQHMLETAKSAIDALDPSPWMAQLVGRYGWAAADAKLICDQYKRFLFLKFKYQGVFDLPPSTEIDEVWHIHILDTRAYARDTQAIFGEFLHHNPQIVETPEAQAALSKAFFDTQRLYAEEFGEELIQIRYRIRDLLKAIF